MMQRKRGTIISFSSVPYVQRMFCLPWVSFNSNTTNISVYDFVGISNTDDKNEGTNQIFIPDFNLCLQNLASGNPTYLQ